MLGTWLHRPVSERVGVQDLVLAARSGRARLVPAPSLTLTRLAALCGTAGDVPLGAIHRNGTACRSHAQGVEDHTSGVAA